MNDAKRTYLGFDCGNSSIRTVLGSFDGSHISLEVINQVPNREYGGIQYDYWDILAIFHEMLKGMKIACDNANVSSFGISTWGIDFGILGKSGELLGNPLCYRNVLGAEGLASCSPEERERFFAETGIQNLPMNSLYQLLGIRKMLPEYYNNGKHILLIPDLLNHLLTGEMNSEISIASTTQLVDMRKRDYCPYVFSQTGLNRSLFPPLVGHKQIRGRIKASLAEKFGIPQFPAISVPSHDTAAAVVCVPSEEQRFAFISSGTWSLIGTECYQPIINEEVKDAQFSNEGGVFDSITLLKNSCGMHILQHIKRELEFSDNRQYTWDEIVNMSMPFLESNNYTLFDPNESVLYHPVSMIEAITSLTGETSLGAVLASAYSSLAMSYRNTIADLERITGESFDAIHIIGGGSRNTHLNQMTAQLSKKRVVAGPEEATSLGIIALQIMHDFPHITLSDIRSIIRSSTKITYFDC